MNTANKPPASLSPFLSPSLLDKGTGAAPRVLMLDNYDSFTWNLVQYLEELGADVLVVRNDAATVEDLSVQYEAGAFNYLMVSPGPCSPKEAGISVALIEKFLGCIPILGVCLGHQSLAVALGGEIIRAKNQMHGKTSRIKNQQQGVFQNLPSEFTVNRYHSLVINPEKLPQNLTVTAWSDDGEIMAVRHQSLPKNAPAEGVQFHPESILTEYGHALLKNFLNAASHHTPSSVSS